MLVLEFCQKHSHECAKQNHSYSSRNYKKKKSGGQMFDAVVFDAHQTVKEDVFSF